jgi:hypothetical protein
MLKDTIISQLNSSNPKSKMSNSSNSSNSSKPITSINNSQDGRELALRAETMHKSTESSVRYADWLSLSELDAGVKVRGKGAYKAMDKKAPSARAYYAYEAVRNGAESEESALEEFDGLAVSTKDVWATKLVDLRSMVAYHIYGEWFSFVSSSVVGEEKAYDPIDAETPKGQQLSSVRTAIRLRVETLEADLLKGYTIAPIRENMSIVDVFGWHHDSTSEPFRFLTQRVLGKGAYNKTTLYCNMMGFVTEVLGRPCHPFSVIFPLRRSEFLMLQNLGVPEHLFKGTALSPSVCFGEILKNKSGYKHETASGFFLDWASSDNFFTEMFVPHAMRAYRTFRISKRLCKDPSSGVESILTACQQVDQANNASSAGTFNTGFSLLANVFEMLQTIRGDMFALYPQDAHFFGVDMSTNMRDPLHYKFSELLLKLKCVFAKQRSHARRAASEREFRESDGSGKIERGRMLDPVDKESGRLFQRMLDCLGKQVWEPLKSNFVSWCAERFSNVNPDSVLLSLDVESAAELSGRISAADANNLTTFILVFIQCDFVPLRSQILRDSLIHEYTLESESQQIRLTMDKRRGFKTLASQGNAAIPAVTTWLLPKGLAEVIQYYKMVCRPLLLGKSGESTSMFLNRNGKPIQQAEIYATFNGLGRQWLGIPRFGIHICRSFVISAKAHSGEIDASNLAEIASLMQTSTGTLHTNYVARINGNSTEQLANRVFGGASSAFLDTTRNASGKEGGEGAGESVTESVSEPAAKKQKISSKGVLRAREAARGEIKSAFNRYMSESPANVEKTMRAFVEDLRARRNSNMLRADEAWFAQGVTRFPEGSASCYNAMSTFMNKDTNKTVH